MQKKTIIILGGGTAGQVAAHNFGKALGGLHRVLLIEKEARHVFGPSLLWRMVGLRTEEAITRPTATLSAKGVEIVQAEIQGIDPEGKRITTNAGEFVFDFLLVGLGAELAPDLLPGFSEGCLNLYNLDGANRIYDALKSFSGGRVAVLVSSSPFKCPAAPYEACFLIQSFLQKRGVKAELDVYTPETLPMPTAGAAVGQALKSMLEGRGIGFHPGQKAREIDPKEKRIKFDGGTEASYDLLVGVPPHRAPAAVAKSSLAGPTGWIPVDRSTLASRFAGIYAVGDVAGIPLGESKMLPKAGVFAHRQAEVAASNIIDEIEGRSPSHRFDGHGWCAIEIGEGKAGFGSGNFYAEGGPVIHLSAPSRIWHWAKVAFEKWWLWKWFTA